MNREKTDPDQRLNTHKRKKAKNERRILKAMVMHDVDEIFSISFEVHAPTCTHESSFL
jgi:hypothetical protein